MKRRKVDPDAQRAVLDLLRSDEFREGFRDGFVSVKRANLIGAMPETILDLNHCELLAPSDENPEGPAIVVRHVIKTLNWK